MQNLSDDLLYTIFLLALPSKLHLTFSTTAPVNFSLVCRRWRKLVLSRPKLWASMSIEDDPLHMQSMEYIYNAVRIWLRLSDSAPLTIQIEHEERRSKESTGFFPNDLLYLLAQECHRWEDVSIFIENDCLNAFDYGSTMKLSSAPPLRRLSLYFTGRFWGTWPTIACIDLSPSVVGASSSLRELVLGPCTTWSLPPHSEALHLPYLNALSVTIRSNEDLANTFRVLSASPALNSLVMIDQPTHPSSPSSFRDPLVSLPKLEHFTLQSEDPNTAQRLLSSLATPSLRSFKLYASLAPAVRMGESANEARFIPMAQILRFFSRNRPPRLSCLDIRYNSYSTTPLEPANTSLEELLGLLSASLRRLVLHGPIVDNELIELLTVRAAATGSSLEDEVDSQTTNRALCPSLAVLRLSRSSLSEAETFGIRMDKVEEMVLSRWKHGEGALKEVGLQLPWFDQFVRERTRMKVCVDEGLKISCERSRASAA